jgi:hypothetical protein
MMVELSHDRVKRMMVALLKDPPAKEDCPICFLPMPVRLICCISLPPATIISVPINDFAIANTELVNEDMETYFRAAERAFVKGAFTLQQV